MICKVCVVEMFEKFKRDEKGETIFIEETFSSETEWKCPNCGSTTSGVTLLEIYAQVKQNAKDIKKLLG